MNSIPCPVNGLRDQSEFLFAGQVKPMPPASCTEEEWVDYLFNQQHTQVVQEWWLHIASDYWFIVERDQTGAILRSYDPSELFQPLSDVEGEAP